MTSVLIPVRNERANIVDCLESVRWADEIVVVDSGSKDGTVELAKSHGAQVIDFEWNGQYPKKKNWALEQIPWKSEWILILDADERITPELAREIQQKTKHSRADGYFINRRFIFLGKWIRHCGYYPSWNLRLFRRGKGRYEKLHGGDTKSGDNEVHEHVLLDGPAEYLNGDMLHFAYPDIHTWMEKHNRYSNWEASVEMSANGAVGGEGSIGNRLAQRRKLRTLSRSLPLRPTLRFLYSFILKRGFLDGYEGYIFCRLLAIYEALSVFKTYEFRSRAKSPAV